jgi:urease gamma subunit
VHLTQYSSSLGGTRADSVSVPSETVAVITSFVPEAARDGRTAQLMEAGRQVLAVEDVPAGPAGASSGTDQG